MRMWMVSPNILCVHHLLGEHNELHMLCGCLLKNKSLKGYLKRELIDLSLIEKRHEKLVAEFVNRGYNHKSPMPVLPEKREFGKVNLEKSLGDLLNRCPKCKERYLRWIEEVEELEEKKEK